MDKDSSDIMKGGSYIADVADDYWRGKNRASRGDRGRGERGSHDNRGGYESRGRGKKGGYKDSHEQTSKQEMDYNFHASQNQEEYKSDYSWQQEVESIPIIAPQARFEDGEHKIEDYQPDFKKKGSSYGSKNKWDKNQSSYTEASFGPEVYGQDDFGTFDIDGYYFDHIGYYDHVGYFDEVGYYEVDNSGIKKYIDPFANQPKKHHNRGDFAHQKYSQEFVEVKEEKPKRHQSRQHKDEKEIKHNAGKKNFDEPKGDKNTGGQQKMKKHESNKDKKHFEGHKEDNKQSKEFNKKEQFGGQKGFQKAERKDKKVKDDNWEQEQDVKIQKMVFLNPYKSKFAEFVTPVISNNSNYYTTNWNDGMTPPKESSSIKRQLPDEVGKKYTVFDVVQSPFV